MTNYMESRPITDCVKVAGDEFEIFTNRGIEIYVKALQYGTRICSGTPTERADTLVQKLAMPLMKYYRQLPKLNI